MAEYIEGADIININSSMEDQTFDIVVSAERRVAQLEKIIELSLKRTNENDWVNQQGKPYLTSSGAEKIGRLFSVSWKILKNEKIISSDEERSFYFYQTTGIFKIGKFDEIEAIGTCSSKDPFFAKVNGKLKPLSEIDETNIMKAAYSNCIVNGITRILGIRNLTLETVTKYIDINKVANVEYATGGAGGGLISEAQGKRLFAICKSVNLGTEEIKSFLKEKYNLESSKEIKKSEYNAICDALQALGKSK